MDNTFICDRCGERHERSERFMVGEEELCRRCAGELTILCDECGTRIYRDDDQGDAHMYFASSATIGITLAATIAGGLSETNWCATATGTTTRYAENAMMKWKAPTWFTNTITYPTLFSMAKGCGISVWSWRSMGRDGALPMRKSCCQ